ncbi:MAG: M23 family metallopeptidase [Bdellovibrionales bacterium]|nr:M23 family metallopeptidase [Bdellovibrionales bacterium]
MNIKTAVLFILVFLISACSHLNMPAYKKPAHYNSYSAHSYSSGELELIWPIERARLTQPFAPPANPKHDGIDLAAPLGTKIFAAHSGRVIFAGRKYRGYGKMIILKYNNSYATLYAHLHKIHVKRGDWVKVGDTIAAMGSTGRSTGVHLHFEVLRNKIPVNPLAYLDQSYIKVADK